MLHAPLIFHGSPSRVSAATSPNVQLSARPSVTEGVLLKSPMTKVSLFGPSGPHWKCTRTASMARGKGEQKGHA